MEINIDHASELEEFHRNEALKFRMPEGPAATGLCLYCEDDLEEGRRWCDAICRDRWERSTGHGQLPAAR
ncbi:hypothetical protein J2T57_001388 [Natronocella acetinitrilica]|uniref:DUF2116 family Zn-ribbon domain-containing protein n=1 Tax=Natronocella acetinitrilica TaxID=414046 RepID=A0AAE3KB64_9GAMM|nr:hypothetical protein [Natronocella acetinitrilica]MCP1674286.1 hypothetical protein [Natronocella acetinitrilica]